MLSITFNGNKRRLKQMVKVYVLINVETGSEEEVMASLRSIPEVKEAQMVYGVYCFVDYP